MDRIHGKTLEQLWPVLSWLRTIKYAWRLRTFVRSMRQCVSEKGGGLASGRIFTPFIDNLKPLARFISATALAEHMNWWLLCCRPKSLPPRHDLALKPLTHHVFTHQDLAPRNIIVDDEGKLWVVDWGYAGYFPIYFEYVGMDHGMTWLYESSWTAHFAKWRWSLFRWIVTGPYHSQSLSVLEVRRRSMRFRGPGSKPPHTEVSEEQSVIPSTTRWER